MNVGDKCIVIERTTNEIFEWDAEITIVEKSFIETKHRRSYISNPEWIKYIRAYELTWVKHYFHPDNKLINIKMY